jgi:hypothetical protein
MVHDRDMTNAKPSRPTPEDVVASIVATDEHDDASNLSRPDAFRLNVGVDRETFERVADDAGPDPDYTAFDRVMPHPVYAAQRWICIVNPSERTYRELVVPLLTVAHDRLAAQRKRRPGK